MSIECRVDSTCSTVQVLSLVPSFNKQWLPLGANRYIGLFPYSMVGTIGAGH